ncbi:MAG: hypothetical protein JWM86_232 [Thermoleophilia bacterium]|nr:hypothetical protein [Thermoleophilia bacterium]
MADDQDLDKHVTIDIETATETATRPEDVARIRREAGLEEGEAPPRGEPSGEDSEAGQRSPRGESGDDTDTDHTVDDALDARVPGDEPT